jgi:hypothetical protein
LDLATAHPNAPFTAVVYGGIGSSAGIAATSSKVKRSPSNAPIAATRLATKLAAENKDLLGNWFLTYRTRERVRDDFDRRLQCLEPPLAIASMRPLARMVEDVALDVLFDGG